LGLFITSCSYHNLHISDPKCDSSYDVLDLNRRIGYYGLFNLDKQCNQLQIEDIQVAALTHLYLAFFQFTEAYIVMEDYRNALYRASLLKINNPSLRVVLSIGGWDFSDPPTADYWSNSMLCSAVSFIL
jgi:GH18 family chitinase